MNRGLLVAALLAVGACASPEEEAELGAGALVGGEVVGASELGATVDIVGSCTATRVGPSHLLTAAHCVANVSGYVRGERRAGAAIDVAVRGDRPGVRNLRIVDTAVHPRWARLCASKVCSGVSSKDTRDAPDVAVIEVDGDLDGVPTAAISVAPARHGEAVDLVGYGCRTSVYADDADGQLRRHTAKVASAEDALAAGEHSFFSVLGDPIASRTLAEVYTLTLGRALADDQASLCPGDSGGPLFRAGTDQVVGVHASYTVRFNDGVSRTNWHARTDGEARWGVARWLESRGAVMTEACTDATCVPVGTD